MAALRTQEDEYENMKKLLLLKKIQQEINGSNLMEEVATNKRMKEAPKKKEEITLSATEEDSRRLRTLRRRRQRSAAPHHPNTTSFTLPPDDITTDTHQQVTSTSATTASVAPPEMILLDDDDNDNNNNGHKQAVGNIENNKKETVRAEPSSVFSDLPSTKYYDTKLYDSQVRTMTSKEIDRELAALEKKHEESRFQFSDFLAEQLKRSYQPPSDYTPLSLKTAHDPNKNSTTKTHTHINAKHKANSNTSTNPTNNVNSTATKDNNDNADLEADLSGELDLGEENAGGGEVRPPPLQVLDNQPKYLPVPLPYPELSSDFLLQSQARGVRPNAEIPHNQFLDIVDIDKRSFGVGPIKLKDSAPIVARPGDIGATKRGGGTLESASSALRRSTSVGEVPKRKPGGMNARLEALAQQLDQIEQSAYALQHDLAFSAKVVKNIDSDTGANPHGILQQEDADPVLLHSASASRISHSLPSSPSSQSSPSSPRFPYHPPSHQRAHQQLPSQSQPQRTTPSRQPHSFNQHTHQRIQDAMDLLNNSSTAGSSGARKGRPNISSSSPSATNKGERSNNNNKRNETAQHERKGVEAHHHHQQQQQQHDWLLVGEGDNRDELSETQIQKLLSMSTLNASNLANMTAPQGTTAHNNNDDASVDWDLVEQILQE